MLARELTKEIISAAIEVHRALGPGLLESAYEECLCRELNLRGIPLERQVPLPVEFKGVRLECGYRLDLLVDKRVVVEINSRISVADSRSSVPDLAQAWRLEGRIVNQLQRLRSQERHSPSRIEF